MKYLLYIIFVLTLFSCQKKETIKETKIELDREITQKFTLDTSKIAVLEYQKYDYSNTVKNVKEVKLTNKDFELIEELTKKAIKNHNWVVEDKIELDNYYRQYVVTENNLGEKKVWVNCFCEEIESEGRKEMREKYKIFTSRDNWRKEIVQVFDGKKCYFNLEINLSKKQYYNFVINGEA